MKIKGEIVIVNDKYHRKDIVGMTGVVCHDQLGTYVEIEPLQVWQEKGYKGIFSIPEECLED